MTNNDDSKITTRLNDVMNSILCPVAGCWPIHGARSEYFYDDDAESHVLEVWPLGVEEPEEYEGNGREQSEPGLMYEAEDGHQLELRVHIVPIEDEYGILCDARLERRVMNAPLGELEHVKGKPNRQLVDDYCYWLHNWR